MMIFGTEFSTWLAIILIILVIGIIVYLFYFIMSKVFNLNKEKRSEYTHVNALHKIIARWLFVILIALMFVGVIIDVIREGLEPIFLLKPHILAFEVIYVSQFITIYMEWKYGENRNVYLFRIVELIFFTILLLIVYKYFVIDNILNFSF